tara:strand:- start:1018 stop:1488 length:471 start_codon:yes stop_codon:yes gene_type:complete
MERKRKRAMTVPPQAPGIQKPDTKRPVGLDIRKFFISTAPVESKPNVESFALPAYLFRSAKCGRVAEGNGAVDEEEVDDSSSADDTEQDELDSKDGECSEIPRQTLSPSLKSHSSPIGNGTKRQTTLEHFVPEHKRKRVEPKCDPLSEAEEALLRL